jgi:hypothetical protein
MTEVRPMPHLHDRVGLGTHLEAEVTAIKWVVDGDTVQANYVLRVDGDPEAAFVVIAIAEVTS